MQACSVRRHALTSMHQLALRCFLCPSSSLVLSSNIPKSDQQLLKGSVPQPQDWLRAWKAVARCLSMRTAASLNFTEQFISSYRVAVQEVERRAFQKMVFIMQEAVRIRKRDVLRSAVSLTLSVDDKSPYREVRFKCCTKTGMTYRGVVCVLHTSIGTETPDEIDEDKCRKIAKTIVEGFKQLCTPLQKDLDSALFQHCLKVCKVFCADGAPSIQKTGKILRANHMPNMILIVRDFAHMLRSSAKDPLLAENNFSQFWNMLFGKGGNHN